MKNGAVKNSAADVPEFLRKTAPLRAQNRPPAKEGRSLTPILVYQVKYTITHARRGGLGIAPSKFRDMGWFLQDNQKFLLFVFVLLIAACQQVPDDVGPIKHGIKPMPKELELIPRHTPTVTTPSPQPKARREIKKISQSEMAKFDWRLDNDSQSEFLPEFQVYGRDLEWAIQHRSLVKAQRDLGKKFICYINIGALQDTPYYQSHYAKLSVCGTMPRWGESWLDWASSKSRTAALSAYQNILRDAAEICDGLEYDNTDPYENFGGKCNSSEDSKALLISLCDMTHSFGLSCFLKNTFDLIADLATQFDGLITEQCLVYGTCAKATAMTRMGKPVYDIEYQNAHIENQGHYRGRDTAADCRYLSQALKFSGFAVEANQNVRGKTEFRCQAK